MGSKQRQNAIQKFHHAFIQKSQFNAKIGGTPPGIRGWL